MRRRRRHRKRRPPEVPQASKIAIVDLRDSPGGWETHEPATHPLRPEQGRPRPGMTSVDGDTHPRTTGAFGALAFGIGPSEVEHVLATQTLIQRAAKNMLIRADGELPLGCPAKDLVLAIIGKIGTAG